MGTITAKDVLSEIKGIGPSTRQAVLGAYPDLEDLERVTVEDLTEVKGVGPATARSIKEAVAKAEVTRDSAAASTTQVGKTTQTQAKAATGATKAKGTAGDAARGAQKRTSQARDTAARKAESAKRRVDAEVVELGNARDKVGNQADNTVAQVKGAITSVQNIILAALAAGKDQWPQTERQLKAALTSLRKTGQTLKDAAKDVRKSG